MTDGDTKNARLMGMARTAELAGNQQEAISYYNRVLEEDPTVSEAWLGKGRAAGWSSSLAQPRLNETMVAFSNAVGAADDDLRLGIAARAASDVTDIAQAVYNMAWRHFLEFSNVDGAWNQCLQNGATVLDAMDLARGWAPDDRRPRDLTVQVSQDLLDEGVSGELEDLLRQRRETAMVELERIDPDYLRPALATVTNAEKAEAKNASDAVGYVVAVIMMIVLAVVIAAQRS